MIEAESRGNVLYENSSLSIQGTSTIFSYSTSVKKTLDKCFRYQLYS